jgi:Tfp pilus assembly protein PilF
MARLIILSTLLIICSSAVAQKEDNTFAGYEFHLEQAREAMAAGNYESARQHLSSGILTKKSDADMYLLRAKCYIELGNISQAKRDLRRASRIGSYKADQLLDSIAGKSSDSADERFKNDLNRYLED